MRYCAIILAMILHFSNALQAQKPTRKPATPGAVVEVIVVDDKNRPRKGELILLQSLSSNKKLTGRTDAAGKSMITVPAGDDYAVTLKALADSNQYGTLPVPALQPGQSFTGNFQVEIVYEPAKSFTLDNVHFDVGKATLRSTSFKELNELVEYLKWKDDQKIEIAGHTDDTGNDMDNLKLSQQRADAVRDYLVTKSIKPVMVTAKGYGSSQPVADNSTATGKQKNRRTEVRLLD
ncbi:OmpA family protein [Aridibaculum aurantiacum]|uniref:OmpA family protein n=1 Tax=Aridibaculum aurantiacum TaxID=2810307 RepID=UPI001A96B64F|nr:OmpA family protein [Aridibaculum aurantiacum]